MSRNEHMAEAGSGVAATLPELIALRALVQGRRGARQGRHGLHGHALSNLRGRGMEYAESREYAQGDDARHIDWRLTARSDARLSLSPPIAASPRRARRVGPRIARGPAFRQP